MTPAEAQGRRGWRKAENPHEVWIALPKHAWKPRTASVLLRVTWLSPDLLEADVEEHVIEGVPVKVFSAARSVADCFRHRNQDGQEAAVTALRDCLRKLPRGLEGLRRCAERRRVLNVIRPYVVGARWMRCWRWPKGWWHNA